MTGTDPIELAAGVEAMWQLVLPGTDPEDLRTESFFELGGTSVQFLELSRLLKTRYGVTFPLRELMVRTTVGAQAELLMACLTRQGELADPPSPPLTGQPLGGSAPATVAVAPQQEVKLRRLHASGGDGRKIFATFIVRGQFDPERFRRSAEAALATRDALTGRFAIDPDGTPVWIPGRNPLSGQDNYLLRTVHSEAEAWQCLATSAARPLDPWTGRLFDLCIAALGTDRHYVQIIVSHLALDGWSLAILLDQLTDLYNGAVPAPQPRFYRWVQQLRDAIQQCGGPAGVVEDWYGYLGRPPYARGRPLPPAKAGLAANCLKLRGGLDPQQTRTVRQAAACNDATMFSVLLAALHRMESRETDHDRLYSTAASSRDGADSENLVGVVSDARVLLRCRTSPSADAASALREAERSRRQALSLIALPYRSLLDQVGKSVLDESSTPYLALNPAWLSTPRRLGNAEAVPVQVERAEDYPKYVQYWWTDAGSTLTCTLRVPGDRFDRPAAEALLAEVLRTTVSFATCCLR